VSDSGLRYEPPRHGSGWLHDLQPASCFSVSASRLLAGVRPVGSVHAARKEVARDLVADIQNANRRIKALTAQIAATVAEQGRRLTTVDGLGSVVARRLPGRTRRASQFQHRVRLCQIRWRRPDRSRRGRPGAAPPTPRRRSPTQPRPAHRGAHPGPDAGEQRLCQLQRHNRCRKDPQRGEALLETRLADHVWRLMPAHTACRHTRPQEPRSPWWT
jgi:hypothetical protein